MGSGMLKMLLNHVASDYGTVEEVKIDKKDKTARLRVMLRGETQSVTFKVGHYALEAVENGETAIRLKNVSCDREWMGVLLGKFVENKSFPLPRKQKDLLVGFLS